MSSSQSRHIRTCMIAISGGFTRKLRIFCSWKELYAYEAHAEPAIQLPIGDRCRFCRGSDPNTIKTSNSFASLDLRSSTPPYHHTPWGLSSWQSDRPTLTVSSGYGGWSTRRASTACFTAMAPSCRSPGQGFQAWAWPAHPSDSFLAYETGPRLLPGSCPTPFMGKVTGGGVCVCVCVCVSGQRPCWHRRLEGGCLQQTSVA